MAATVVVGAVGSAWTLSRALMPLLYRAFTGASGSQSNTRSYATTQNTEYSRITTGIALTLLQIGILGVAFLFVVGILMSFVSQGQARKSVMDRKRAQGKLTARTIQQHDRDLDLLRDSSPEFQSLINGAEVYSGLSFGDSSAAIDTINQSLFGLQLATILTGFGAALLTGISSTAGAVANVAQSVWGNKEVWLIGGTVAAALTILLNYSDVILGNFRLVWAYNVRPVVFETFLFPLLALVVTGVNLIIPAFEAGYGAFRLSQIVPLRILKLLVFERSRELFTVIARAFTSFLTAVVQWGVSERVSLDNIPLIPFISNIQQLVHLLYRYVVKTACPIVDYVLGPIDVAFLHISLTRALNGLINVPVVLFQQLVLQYTRWRNRPDTSALIDQSTITLTNAAFWIENITLAYADRYIGNDIVNISILMDQGQLPPGWDQWDGFAYTVRAFRMDIFGSIALFVLSWLAFLGEVVKIIINTDVWFTPGGYTFWTFQDLWQIGRNFFEALASIVNVFPQCVSENSPTYSVRAGIYYGDLVAGSGRTLFGGTYYIKDVTVGTVYTLLEGTQKGPFHFHAGYLLADGPVIQEVESQTTRFARAAGCLFSQLDPSLANTVTNAIILVFNTFVFLVLSFVTYTGYAFEQPASETVQPADVMDELDPVINKFEKDALGLTGLFGFLYRWSGTDARGCLSTISPLCALGQLLSRILEFTVRAAAFLLRVVKNTVKVLVALITNLITRFTLDAGRVTQISTKPLSRTAYLIGRFAAVLFGSLIPIPLPCHEDRPNFCAVRGYNPVPDPQNPTICLSTFASLAGSALIGAPVEITLNLLEIGANFRFTDLSDDGVFVKFVRDLMEILKTRVAAPILPLGIFLDCWVSALIQPSDAVSKILGLIYDSFVNFVDKLGPIFIRIIQLIVKILSVVFGGKITAALIGSIITDLFNIWIDGLVEFAKWAFGFVLGFILDFIEGACSFFNNQACLDWIRSVRGTVSGFLGTRSTRDYLRDLGDTAEGRKKRGARVPSNKPLFPHTASAWERINSAYAEQESRKRNKQRAAFSNSIDELFEDSPECVEVLFRSFGYIYNDTATNETRIRPLDMDNMPTHMATYVRWTPGTMAAVLMARVNGTLMYNMDPGTFTWFYMFVSLRAMAVLVAATVPGMGWLPDDTFYNLSRVFMVAMQTVRSILVFLQYFSDRAVPHEKVMSKSYQEFWGMLTVNTTHYTHEFLDLYPAAGANASALDLIPFESFRSNLTLMWYYSRNFQDDDVTNSVGNGSRANGTKGDALDTFSNSFQRLWSSSTDFLWFGMEKQINYTTSILGTNTYMSVTSGIDVASNLSLTDGSSYSVDIVYRQENVSNIRYEVWRTYGDEGVNVHDSRVSYLGLYLAVADFMRAVVNSFSKAISAYTDIEVDFMDTLSDNYRQRQTEDTVAPGGSGLTNSSDTSSSSFSGFPASVTLPGTAPSGNPTSSKRNVASDSSSADERAERVARRKAIEARRLTVPPRPRFSWNYLISTIGRGYAEYVDSFMRVNNASLETWGDGSEFANRTQMGRVVITAVAATAAYFNLSTSYTPAYCNSTDDAKLLCARADWRNAALYLQNDTALFNLFLQTFNGTTGFIADMFRPRTQLAARARTFTGRLITDTIDFVGDIAARFQQKLGEHRLWEEYETARLLFRARYNEYESRQPHTADEKATFESLEQEFETVYTQKKRALQEQFERTHLSALPGVVKLSSVGAVAQVESTLVEKKAAAAGEQLPEPTEADESLQRIIKFYTDQKWQQRSTDPRTGRRSLEDQEQFYSFVFKQLYGPVMDPVTRESVHEAAKEASTHPTDSGNSASTPWIESIKGVLGDDPLAAWKYVHEQVTLKNPDKMRLGRPAHESAQAAAAAVNGSKVVYAAARAWMEWLQEERNIEDDRHTYRAMFEPVEPLVDSNTVPDGLRENSASAAAQGMSASRIVAGAVRMMTIKSRTIKQQLVQRLAGMSEEEARDQLDQDPGMRIDIRGYRRAKLAKGPSKRRSGLQEWTLLEYDSPGWAKWATGSVVKVASPVERAHVTASGAHTIRHESNVIEVKITTSADLGVDTLARSHFFFPTSINESVDAASSLLSCAFPGSFICDPVDGCPIVANTFDSVKGQILTGVDAYINWVPPMVAANIGFLNYVTNRNATARIGYGLHPPRLFGRGYSFWYGVRGLASEVAGAETGDDGPKWSAVFDNIVDNTLPLPSLDTLWTNGTNYQDYLVYRQLRLANNVSQVFPYNQNEAYYSILYVIQDGLGIKFLEFVDTVVGYTTIAIPYFAEWAYSLVKCDYRQDVDCSVRQMSLSGAIYKWATFALAFLFIVYVVSSGNLFITLPVLSFVIMITPYVIFFLAYSYSMACFPLIPRCFIQDVFDLLVYTAEPRCGMLEGTLVQEENYNSNTCYRTGIGLSGLIYNVTGTLENPAFTFTDANCVDYGFRNEYDGLSVQYLVYKSLGRDPPLWLTLWKGAIDSVYSLARALFGDSIISKPATSRAWSSDALYRNNYLQSDAAFSIWNFCSSLVLTQQTSVVALKAAFAATVAAPLASALLTTLQAMLPLLAGILVTIILAFSSWPHRLFRYAVYNSMQNQLQPGDLQETVFGPLLAAERKNAKLERKAARQNGGGDDGDGDDDDDNDDDDDDNNENDDDKQDIDNAGDNQFGADSTEGDFSGPTRFRSGPYNSVEMTRFDRRSGGLLDSMESDSLLGHTTKSRRRRNGRSGSTKTGSSSSSSYDDHFDSARGVPSNPLRQNISRWSSRLFNAIDSASSFAGRSVLPRQPEAGRQTMLTEMGYAELSRRVENLREQYLRQKKE